MRCRLSFETVESENRALTIFASTLVSIWHMDKFHMTVEYISLYCIIK
uniref:Uncharacterized protein n=1 Tax=Rhizophora mucronata TaxID=61149 RepID=A0A2P2R0P5_RHIMU